MGKSILGNGPTIKLKGESMKSKLKKRKEKNEAISSPKICVVLRANSFQPDLGPRNIGNNGPLAPLLRL